MNEFYFPLAGLGLFLAGLQLLSTSMLPLAGKRLRNLLSRLTNSYFSSAIAGCFLGAITQSTSGSTFVCMGMLKSGVMDFKRMLVLLAWSGVGTSILVFLVSVDIRLAGIFIVSMVGLAYLVKLERLKYTKHIIAIAFSLGILFLGLGMMKEASHLLNQSAQVKSFVLFSSHYLFISLIAGLLLSVLTQSSSTVTVIAITLCASGIIGFRNAVIFVFGANIGSGLSLLLISMHLNGMSKQLAAFQCFVKVAGVLVILPILLIVEPIVHSTTSNQLTSTELAKQVSIIFLSLQVVGAICTTAFRNQLVTLLEDWFPNSLEDSLSRPQFIYPEAADDTEIALLLLKKEQTRFIRSFTHYLEPLSQDAITNNDFLLQNKSVHQSNKQLAEHIQLFTESLAKNNTNESAIALIFKAQSLNQSLFGLNETLYTFSNALLGEQHQFKGVALHSTLLESVNLILLMFADATQDDDEKLTLIELTSDKSQMMKKIRHQLIDDLSIPMQVRQSLIFSTGLFERLIWQVRQVAVLL